MRHQRILVIGCAGAGKSTFSRQLHQLTGLPLIHLDQLFWQPGWIPTERPVFREKMLAELQKEAWIMDGNFDSTLSLRAQYADLIIWLDFPRHICFPRVLKRAVTNFGKTRPDMTPGCPEKLDLEFAKWIWHYEQDARPDIAEAVRQSPCDSIIFAHPHDLTSWLERISSN